MKSFDEVAAKAANGLTLTPLECIVLEGPCIDNQKRLSAFNRAIDDADRELQALTEWAWGHIELWHEEIAE